MLGLFYKKLLLSLKLTFMFIKNKNNIIKLIFVKKKILLYLAQIHKIALLF
uniref:Uncharacterized protein n=1 Tax=Physcomitrium patens TaxID=3218 RepID=A0A2K1KQ16_PHYPA|nr:hypothetical protein PHYPA_006766 [Physcomitrium patens]